MASSPAVRRYNARVLLLSAAYALLLFTAVYLFRHHPPTGPSAYLIAVAPALPIVGVFAAIGRYLVEERDEYLRALMARQSLIATGLTLGVATIWGFVEDFGLAPHVPAYYTAVLWFGGLGLGACINRALERRA